MWPDVSFETLWSGTPSCWPGAQACQAPRPHLPKIASVALKRYMCLRVHTGVNFGSASTQGLSHNLVLWPLCELQVHACGTEVLSICLTLYQIKQLDVVISTIIISTIKIGCTNTSDALLAVNEYPEKMSHQWWAVSHSTGPDNDGCLCLGGWCWPNARHTLKPLSHSPLQWTEERKYNEGFVN